MKSSRAREEVVALNQQSPVSMAIWWQEFNSEVYFTYSPELPRKGSLHSTLPHSQCPLQSCPFPQHLHWAGSMSYHGLTSQDTWGVPPYPGEPVHTPAVKVQTQLCGRKAKVSFVISVPGRA